MPLFVDSGRFGTSLELNAANCITVGLINNMPDAALEATERQFTGLIRAAAPDVVVLLKLFAIAEVPRGAAARRELAERYRDVAELWNAPLDGLIVTGAEPRAAALTDESYWATLGRLVDWARDNTASTIWSCLAAHAAVLHADGIERRALKHKQFGVFACRLADEHPMTRHGPQPLLVPHSRHHDVPEPALAAAGYSILTRANGAGVDAFAKQDGSLFLYFQGHPEYAADTLLREYCRDVTRYLRGERERYPAPPVDYLDDDAAALADAFRARALADRRGELAAEFPKAELETGLACPWRAAAVDMYRRWTGYLAARKAERRLAVPLPGIRLRRTWRDWPRGTRLAENSTR